MHFITFSHRSCHGDLREARRRTMRKQKSVAHTLNHIAHKNILQSTGKQKPVLAI